MPRYATEDEILARRLRRETHRIRRFRHETLRELERERPGDRWADGLHGERSLWRDDLRAVRQHAVVVAEVDLGLPPQGHDQREATVAEAVEVERAVHPGEAGDELEARGLRGSVEAEPGRVDVRAGPRGGGDTERQQDCRRVREAACRHERRLRVAP